MATLLDAQLGIGEEVTYGTYQAPTRFFEFTEESLKLEVERTFSQAYRNGRRTRHRVHGGVQRVAGDFTIELAPQGTGMLFKHMFGAVNTTGTNPYTHTFTPGLLDDKSLTVQVGRTDTGSVTRAFSYLGCKITEWELAAEVGELAMLTCSLYGTHEDRAQSLAAVSYPTGWSPFTFVHGSLTIAAGAVDIRSFSLSGNNNLGTDRHRISATNPARPKEPLESDVREYSGTISADFESLTAYERYVNLTEAAVVLTFNAGASAQLTITMNVEFDGETPQVAREVLEQPLPFTCVSGTSDDAAITAVLVNADSTP